MVTSARRKKKLLFFLLLKEVVWFSIFFLLKQRKYTENAISYVSKTSKNYWKPLLCHAARYLFQLVVGNAILKYLTLGQYQLYRLILSGETGN